MCGVWVGTGADWLLPVGNALNTSALRRMDGAAVTVEEVGHSGSDLEESTPQASAHPPLITAPDTSSLYG